MLGGLIEDDIQDTKKKVPLLGDIPLLGKLFRTSEKQHTKTSLLVFLRPTVLHTRRRSHRQSPNRKYEKVWEIEDQFRRLRRRTRSRCRLLTHLRRPHTVTAPPVRPAHARPPEEPVLRPRPAGCCSG